MENILIFSKQVLNFVGNVITKRIKEAVKTN